MNLRRPKNDSQCLCKCKSSSMGSKLTICLENIRKQSRPCKRCTQLEGALIKDCSVCLSSPWVLIYSYIYSWRKLSISIPIHLNGNVNIISILIPVLSFRLQSLKNQIIDVRVFFCPVTTFSIETGWWEGFLVLYPWKIAFSLHQKTTFWFVFPGKWNHMHVSA